MMRWLREPLLWLAVALLGDLALLILLGSWLGIAVPLVEVAASISLAGWLLRSTDREEDAQKLATARIVLMLFWPGVISNLYAVVLLVRR